MANNLYDYLRERAGLDFEQFHFGNEMLASIQGETSYLRGSDSLAQVSHAINNGRDVIDVETQKQGHQMISGGSGSAPEIALVPKAIWDSNILNPLKSINESLFQGIKTTLYGAVGITLLVVGLIALIASTDTGKAAIKKGVEAAAV